MTQPSMAEIKSALRQQAIERRNLASLHDVSKVAAAITANLISLTLEHAATTVACYLAFGSEPATDGFLRWALENSVKVMLPVAHDDGEMSWVYFDGAPTNTGIYGFEEAVGDPANLGDADLIVVPALAADTAGHRLGKGKGYYDRALDETITVPIYALVYDAEVLPEVAAEAHDRRVDGIVTEARIIEVRN